MKFIFSILFLLTISSCYQVNKVDSAIPEKLLSKEQMVRILTEVQITEAGFSINKNRINADELKPEYYNKVLLQDSVSLKQFKENLSYYHNTPKVMGDIYEQVLANLSKIQSNVIKEKEELDEKMKIDSIAMVNDSIKLLPQDSLPIILQKSN